MDLKDDEKSRKWCEHPHSSRYYETNAGQVFVNNINPFDTVGGNAGDVRGNLTKKRKNEEFINIFDNKLNKQPNKMHSKGLVNEMLQNYALSNNYNEHMYLKEQYEAHHGGQHRPHAQPMVSMSTNTFNTKFSFCSSDVFKPSRYEYELKYDDYDQDNNRYGASSANEMMSDHVIPDRNEHDNNYCHASPNMYNHDFVYRTIKKNAKLQKIVRKLVIEREREKQREAWNNYINELKNKHRYYSNEPSRISPQYVPGDDNTPEMIDDFYNMRLNWRQSNPCQHLLEDICGNHDDMPSTTPTRNPYNYGSIPPDAGSFIHDNDRFCYPSSSQASMIRLNKERQGYAYNLRARPSGRYFLGNSDVVDTNRANGFDSIHGTARPYFPVHNHTRKPRASAPIQTANLPLVDEEDYKELNVPQAEIVQHGNNLYFPLRTKEITALNHKSVTRYIHHALPLTQEAPRLDKHVNVPSKHICLINNKDINNPDNVTSFKNNLVEKAYIKNYERNDADLQKSESFKENFKKVSENIIKLKAKIRKSEEDTKIKSLVNIEEKIDCLIKSMNSIMSDIQSKRNFLLSKRSAAVPACKIETTSRTILNRKHSDPYNYKNADYSVQVSSRSLTISEIVPNEQRNHTDTSESKMEKILIEEMEKSDKAKSDIEEILNLRASNRSCSLQITFDIPTKERSTETNDSSSKARKKCDKKPASASSNKQGMAIAVNTDPLGLFALLRVSTETVKQILSYMPHLNYESYLSLLPLPLLTKRCIQHYTCNICGASFRQPSELSTHVKQHNLGRARDCCVCRHTLDLKCARAALFRCRYCGQRFTRAYCCELHQQSCARHLGRSHDVTSSHILLQ